MRVYISGSITGTDDYIERFSIIESGLKGMGFEVVNPAAVNARLPAGFSHDDYMHVCFAMLDLCDAIFMLSGWERSDGATREAAYAAAMNIPELTADEMREAINRKMSNNNES